MAGLGKGQRTALIWLYPGLEHGYGPDAHGWTEHWALFSGVGVRAFEELGCFGRNHPLVHLAAADPELVASSTSCMRACAPRVLWATCRHPSTPSSSLSVPGAAALPAPARAIRRTSGEPWRNRLQATGAEPTGRPLLAFGVPAAPLRAKGGRHRPQGIRFAAADVPFPVPAGGEQLPIERIARLVGYQDPAYFSRLFSQRTGRSPSQFRAQHFRADPVRRPLAPIAWR